jgi:predicted deacylase
MVSSRFYLGAVGLILIILVIVFLPGRSDVLTEVPVAEPGTEEATDQEAILIGQSIQGIPITASTFGTGDTNLLFIGGIHGGYEWNTVLLANEMIAYFRENPTAIPKNITVHIVPNLNPDGMVTVFGTSTITSGEAAIAIAPTAVSAGRFNARGVDLNRNFDCRWSETALWRGNQVGTGSGPFSEPESVAIRDYIKKINPAAVVVWHSMAGNVYGAECGEAVSTETLALMNTYATAADYGAVPVFDAYVVQGAIEDWLAGQGIPAISVEFDTRTSSEFEQNLAGTLATLDLYRE